MRELGTAHDRGECIPEYCNHPDHDLEDAVVDVDFLVHTQLEPAVDYYDMFIEL